MRQLFFLLIFILPVFSFSEKQEPRPLLSTMLIAPDSEKYIGPEKGTLVIAGAYYDKPILEKFLSLAGNKESKIVIITTAAEDERQHEKYYNEIKNSFHEAGAKNVKILHTRDTAVANSTKFLEVIKEAGGVWFTGGRQWRLADAYLNTKASDEFNNLLNRGGVIGGNSAGATIQGSFLVRGDTKTPLIMDGDHISGFGFLKNSAIDQHLLVRNRQFDMLEIRRKYPDLLGIGIDQGTAIIVHKNEFEVIGSSCVAVYDGTFWSPDRDSITELPAGSERFYFLSKGDKYDLKNRRPLRKEKQ